MAAGEHGIGTTIGRHAMSSELTGEEREELNRLAKAVVGAAYAVGGELGCGFLEKVYERALVMELQARGLRAESQARINVYYKGECVGEYYADILVEGRLIVELKCVDTFSDEHMAQCLNYLRGTDHHLALLLNFQHPRVQWKRVVWNF